jgi:hypothetical protein
MQPNHTDRRDAPAPAPTLCTVAQLAQIEPALSAGAIRFDLFNRATNGLEASGAVIFRGRRILLHREKYLAWLTEQSRRIPRPANPRRTRKAA